MKPRQAHEVIKAHKNAHATERNRWSKFHDWYLAEQPNNRIWMGEDDWGAEGDELHLETNYPYAWIDTMIASICPTNPLITISATSEQAEQYAQNRERLANYTMRRNKLYKKGWRVAGHAALGGYGVTKTIWDFRKKRPFTRVVDPRKIIWDRGVEDWDDVTYVAEATVLRKEEFLARSRRRKLSNGKTAPSRYKKSVADQANFSAYPTWLKKAGNEDKTTLRDAAKDVFEYVVVWEFWDFLGGNYWHLLENVDEPLFAGGLPYRWVRNPYDLVAFNDNLVDTTGISDVHLIANLQERLNELDTLELWHIQSTMPLTVVNEGALDNPEAAKDAVQNATGPAAIASVKLAQQYRDIREAFMPMPQSQLPPDFRAKRDRIEKTIEFVLGLPQFMRGGLGGTDIATEAALADAGIRTRNGRRIRVMEEWQSSIAQKIIGLWGERMDPGKQVPVRSGDGEDVQMLDYGDLGFDEIDSFDADWFNYDAAPYSPTENNAMVQLQKLQQFMPILLEHPNVDKTKLMSKLLELLKMSELFTKEGAAPMPMQGTPGMPGSAGVPGNDTDVLQQLANSGQIPPELMAQIQAFQQTAAPSFPGVSEPPVEV